MSCSAFCRVLTLTIFFLTPSALLAETPLRQIIDQEIRAGWKSDEIKPPGIAEDAVFLRRVYLDLTGIIPTYEQAKAFLDSKDSEKRSKLIDKLLNDPRYAIHQADIWDMILFGRNPPGYDARDRDGFKKWLRDQFAKNVPYDQWVRTILKGEGNTIDDGAPMYLIQYDRKPLDATAAIVKTFLGVQLQCARCHDHPHEDWKQTDFYAMAAFLSRLERVQVGKQGRLSKIMIGEKNTGEILFTGPVSEERPGKKGVSISPKFLLSEKLKEPPLPKDVKDPRRFPSNKVPPKPYFSRKNALAEWVTSKENPMFARAAANRIWAQFMGRGLIDPVDNMSPGNPASHPKLLKALTQELINHQFDLKWYLRELCNSEAYQLTHKGESSEAKTWTFERARVRPLSAEELVESWRVATGYDQTEYGQREKKKRKGDRFYGVTGGYALRFLGRPNNGVGQFQGGLHEHLYLNNGQVQQLIASGKGGLYDALLESSKSWEERIDRLYLSVLSRYPKVDEQKKFTEYLTAEKEPRYRVKEAIWVLMTCSEFRFNH